jgi:hypothetical protein
MSYAGQATDWGPAHSEAASHAPGRTPRRMKTMHIFEILRVLGALEVNQQVNL